MTERIHTSQLVRGDGVTHNRTQLLVMCEERKKIEAKKTPAEISAYLPIENEVTHNFSLIFGINSGAAIDVGGWWSMYPLAPKSACGQA